MNQSTVVIVNAMVNYISSLLGIAVVFFLTPFVIHKVGILDYGLWTLIFSIMGVFSLMDLGFGVGVVKWVAECSGSQDFKKRNQMIGTLMGVYLGLAILGAIGIAIFSLKMNDWFQIEPLLRGKALALLWILGFRSVIFNLPLSIFRGILFGSQKIYALKMAYLVNLIVYSIGTWILLNHGFSIVSQAWINLAAMLLEHAVCIWLCYRMVPELKVSLAFFDFALFKEVLSFSSSQFIIEMSGVLRGRSAPVIINFFLSLPMVSIYSVGARMSEVTSTFVGQFPSILTPVISKFKGEGSEDKIRFIFINGTKYSLVPAAIIACAILPMAHDIIVTWVGQEFLKAIPILEVLMISMLLGMVQRTSVTVMTMTGHHKYIAKIVILALVINISISLILVRIFGIFGPALAVLVTGIIVDQWISMQYACVQAKISYFYFVANAALPAIFPGIVQISIILLIKALHPPKGWIEIIGETIPGIILYLLLFWNWSLHSYEKKFFEDEVLSKLRINKLINKPWLWSRNLGGKIS